jgi:excisionase family DNA binding protein
MRSMRIDPPNERRLDSWKEIAAYLGRHERTVIRWEKKKRLPVHRVPGGERQAVFAYTAELDAWLKQEELGEGGAVPQGLERDASRQPAKTRYYALAGVVAAGMLLFALLGLRSRDAASSELPVRVGFTLNAVQAFDGANQLLWTHTFPGLLQPAALDDVRPLSDFSYIGDFRGKGDREVLVIAPFYPGQKAGEATRTEVDLFSSRGELLWSYVPQGRFQFGRHEIDGPWVGTAFFVSPRAGKEQIWAAFGQAVWANAFVVSLDAATGKDTLRFVNTGVIHALNEVTTPQGRFLLAGGFNNEPDTGSLAVINEAKTFAVSPQSEGTRHKCVSCETGDPDYYFEFPRSEINELEQIHEDGVIEVNVKGEQIEVRKKEMDRSAGPDTLYLLRADQGMRPFSVRFDSTYDMLHRKLETDGKLDHTLENCPERLNPRPIRMWTPAGGWTDIKLDPSRASE